MIRVFQSLSVALLFIAAYFLWLRELDSAFVTGVLAACAFFLSLRVRFKARSSAREVEKASLRVDEDDASNEQLK